MAPALGEHLLLESWPVLVSATLTIIISAFFGQQNVSKDGAESATEKIDNESEGLLYHPEEEDEEDACAVPLNDDGSVDSVPLMAGLVTVVLCMATMLFFLNTFPEVAGRILQVVFALVLGTVAHYGFTQMRPPNGETRWVVVGYAGGAAVGLAWLLSAYFAPLGVMRGVNDVIVVAVVVLLGGMVEVPSFWILSAMMWLLFCYDYMMTVAVSGALTVCHTEMCGALDVIETYRLPMALRFWNDSALGMGDIMVGAVVLSFGMRKYGSQAALLLAPAYTLGLFLAIYWSSTSRRPIPALVPIVPCMWSVMIVLEMLCTAGNPDSEETSECVIEDENTGLVGHEHHPWATRGAGALN